MVMKQTKNDVLLSSKVRMMVGRERILCQLELGRDKRIRLYKKKDNSLVIEADVDEVTYSAASSVKSRLRIVTRSGVGVRIGIWSVDTESYDSDLPAVKNSNARDVWVSALAKYGAKEDASHPEERLDMYGRWALYLILGLLVLVSVLVITMR